jgi:hypothetical protein
MFHHEAATITATACTHNFSPHGNTMDRESFHDCENEEGEDTVYTGHGSEMSPSSISPEVSFLVPRCIESGSAIIVSH